MVKKSRSVNRKNRKGSRKNRRTNQRGTTRRNYRRMYGGESTPASVGGDSMGGMMGQSLRQGQQFAGYHANQHGGAALEAGPFPGAVMEPSILPQALQASARMAPLNAAYSQIAGLRDQDGGGRRKNRKNSRKNRKNTRKNRKMNRKSRRSNARRNRRGGAYSLADAQSISAPGMLLSPSMEAKAVSGMNAEWRLAENPKAFAPGYAQSA